MYITYYCRNYMFAMRTTWFRLFLHELKTKVAINPKNDIITKSVQGQQFIKILKFHNCIDFFQKFLKENMQRRNQYKVHDREISSHLFNILNVWSIRILHIFFFFMLQRCSYTHVDIYFFNLNIFYCLNNNKRIRQVFQFSIVFSVYIQYTIW
jgi:hypothetical protein